METVTASASAREVAETQFDEDAAEQNALFSRESAENVPIKEDRVVRKVKKAPKNGHMVGDTETSEGALGLSSSLGKKCPLNSGLFASKSNRRRRTVKGRGEPKKGLLLVHF
jgi:hypothetical protein